MLTIVVIAGMLMFMVSIIHLWWINKGDLKIIWQKISITEIYVMYWGLVCYLIIYCIDNSAHGKQYYGIFTVKIL